MNNSKAFIGLIGTTLLHSYCCIFPLFISVWGGFSVLGKLLAFQPIFWLVQGGVLLFTLYGYYFRNENPRKTQRIRIAFVWLLFLYSVGVYIVPHTDIFKTEDEKLMIRQMSAILKLKSTH